jgi:hypothetical protein
MAIKLFLVFVSSQGFDRFTILGFACYLILLASAQFVVLRAAHYRPARLQTIYAFGWLAAIGGMAALVSARAFFSQNWATSALELLPVFGVGLFFVLPMSCLSTWLLREKKPLAPESDPPRAIPRIPPPFWIR